MKRESGFLRWVGGGQEKEKNERRKGQIPEIFESTALGTQKRKKDESVTRTTEVKEANHVGLEWGMGRVRTSDLGSLWRGVTTLRVQSEKKTKNNR